MNLLNVYGMQYLLPLPLPFLFIFCFLLLGGRLVTVFLFLGTEGRKEGKGGMGMRKLMAVAI